MDVLEEVHTLKKTPLYDRHVALNAKIVDFGGYLLPIYYTGIIEEHRHTRTACSFFDVSHLGEFRVHGPGAYRFLQLRLTNDLRKLTDKKMIYSLLCNEQGGILDDILVYQGGHEDFFIVVNASNIAKDLEALKAYLPDSVTIEDESSDTACIAVQGPQSQMILEKLFSFRLAALPYYFYKEERFKNERLWVSRSGYTGEDGFEIFCHNDPSIEIWDRLAKDGKALGALPAGLGARNTLRLEAGNPLYGHEMDEKTTPVEAGLMFAVALDKEEGFVGRDMILHRKETGATKKLVGFKMQDRSIARDGYPVYSTGGEKIGHVTSGSFAPTAGAGIGLAYVRKGFEKVASEIEIEIHGRRAKATLVARPFIDIKHKK